MGVSSTCRVCCPTLRWQVGDAAMVLSLSSLVDVEDRNLLAGSLMVLLEQDINRAQVCRLGQHAGSVWTAVKVIR